MIEELVKRKLRVTCDWCEKSVESESETPKGWNQSTECYGGYDFCSVACSYQARKAMKDNDA